GVGLLALVLAVRVALLALVLAVRVALLAVGVDLLALPLALAVGVGLLPLALVPRAGLLLLWLLLLLLRRELARLGLGDEGLHRAGRDGEADPDVAGLGAVGAARL